MIKLDACDLESSIWQDTSTAVYRYALRRTGRHDLADEIAQDTVVRLIEYHQRQPIRNVMALAFTVAANLISDHARSERRFATVEIDETVSCAAVLPDRHAEDRQHLEIFRAALRRMPKKRREVIIRRRIYPQSCATISDELAISVKAVEKHITRGLLDLHRALDLHLSSGSNIRR